MSSDPQAKVLRRIADPSANRDAVAAAYAQCVLVGPRRVNFPLVNGAILDRWTLSSLQYVKARAWRLLG